MPLPDMSDEELYLRHLHERGFLQALLLDRASKKRVIWATDTYSHMGCPGLGKRDEIDPEILIRHYGRLTHMRRQKRPDRTRSHGEVFTPTHICKRMCDHAHAVLYNDDWQKFVDVSVLEITCGEAPFLASRRHQDSGQLLPVPERFGLLDRKLHIINEKARDLQQWKEWAFRAFEATYGYEFQGDNLLLARINLLRTFEEYLSHRWSAQPTGEDYTRLLDIIVWNIWQMEGLTGTLPLGKVARTTQCSLFGSATSHESSAPPCLIRNWKTHKVITWLSISGEREMKFDFVIGNPPYQEENTGEAKTTQEAKKTSPSIYNYFIDAASEVSDRIMLIHPARFLYDGGTTPKEWNKKMLNDPSFKIVYHELDSSKIFPNSSIMGGIVISYKDKNKNFGSIGTYSSYPEISSIINKVLNKDFISIFDIVCSQGLYRFSKKMYHDYPELMKKFADPRITASAFSRIPDMFHENKPIDGKKYSLFLGLLEMKRVWRWFENDYFNDVASFKNYKIIIPKANGSSPLGENKPTQVMGIPILGEPNIAHTQSFLSIGNLKRMPMSLILIPPEP